VNPAPAPPCPAGRRCRGERAECRYSLPQDRCVLAVAAERPRGLGEIAELLGECSRNAVGQVLQNAMRKLRQHPDVAVLAEFLDDE
jgi:hypothetical protein